MNYILIRHVLAALFSLLSALYLVPVMKNIAKKRKILDFPDGRIKTHKGGIPYLGGIAVYLSFIATLALFFPFKNLLLWLLLGSTLLLFVGLLDDLLVLTPFQKLSGQFVAMLCFLKGGMALKAGFFSFAFNTVASGFWILLIINAFNLVDVMDGLSSTLAIGSSTSFFIIALLLRNYSLSLLLLTFICPLVAFLYYNKPPATIYLGDSGSLFIGGFLAAVPLLFSWSEMTIYGYLTPLIILGVPLLEVAALVVIRTYTGIPFYHGSPHHYSIYLRGKSWSLHKILFFSFSATAYLGFVAISFFSGFFSLPLVFLLLLGFLLAWLKLIFF